MRRASLLVFIVCLSLVGYTSYKMYTLATIRGWVTGARTTTYTVTQKYTQVGRRFRETYWVAWADQEVRESDNNRVQLMYDQWKALHVGSPLAITRVGTSDTPYVRNSYYSSDGDLLIDVFLLCGELFVAFLMGFLFVSRESDYD